jgi:aminomethyltransferase
MMNQMILNRNLKSSAMALCALRPFQSNTFKKYMFASFSPVERLSEPFQSKVVAKRCFGSEQSRILSKTALHSMHIELGGEMVPFAGYELPVLYKGENGGVMKEHMWCREEGKASLFDVSHMGQIRWHGKDRVNFLEKIVVGDIKGLGPGSACLSLVTNESGGIIDDTVITNAGNCIYMVVNGATKVGDIKHFEARVDEFEGDVTMEYLEDSMQLLAVQGPGAADAVAKILPHSFDITNMAFMTGVETTVDGVDGCRITRCGYTGEDGFEISIPADSTVQIASKLLEQPTINPTGLGARDSLRLEAGLCLYGNDLDHTTTPTEGALGWTMGGPRSRRRVEGGFLGAAEILTPEGKLKKTNRKRVGVMGMKAPARENTVIYDASGERIIGKITSGTYSPCLKKPIAMGYVETGMHKNGTEINLLIRNKMQPASITKMPFVEPNYYRAPLNN